MEGWKRQRLDIAAQLGQLVRSAQEMIDQLTLEASTKDSQSRTGRRKGYKASDETKAKLRAAWERRKNTKARNNTRIISPEGRARIAAAQKARWAKAGANRRTS